MSRKDGDRAAVVRCPAILRELPVRELRGVLRVMPYRRQRVPLLILLMMLVPMVLNVTRARAQQVDPASEALRSMLERAEYPLPRVVDRERAALQMGYERHGFRPFWMRDGTVSREATDLHQVLRSADTYGLRPADYAVVRLGQQLDELATHRDWTSEQRARFDVSMSAAALRFVTHLHFGRVDPRACGFHLTQPRPALDAAAVLEQMAGSDRLGELLASWEPPFLHYRLLKQMLVRYRELAAEPDLTKVPGFPGRSVKPGEAYSGAPALRRLLLALGDLPPPASASSSEDNRLDPGLVAGIKHFQSRHGLDADGALGRTTLTALTTPLAQRIRQIEITLERWRWLPPFETPPILVNIPQFRLFAFRSADDRAANILQMPVIVGQTYTDMRTPVFVADMKYVVFRPFWDIPARIMRREMLPAIRANPAYLQRHDFEIVRGQGDDATALEATPENISALASGRLRLRQRPGDDNALGLIKFMLPNAHNVYLHSTPARQLFEKSRRAFSHGCIRVKDPVGLAAHVLQDTPGDWSPAKIEAAMRDEKTLRVNLSRPIPVMILYATALATEEGDVLFFEDIYGHDRKVEALLGPDR